MIPAGGDDLPTIARSTLIERCPVVQTNVRWPAPVDQRLNELLVRLLDGGKGEISRSKLIAVLVATAPTEPDRLDDLVRQYRELRAGAVVLDSQDPIIVPSRRPGRRRVEPDTTP
jgi:hypothetical protein